MVLLNYGNLLSGFIDTFFPHLLQLDETSTAKTNLSSSQSDHVNTCSYPFPTFP